MAGDSDKLVQEYQQLNKTAFVLGYTGAIGQELVKELLGSRIFSKVVLIGRRTVTYEDELYKDVVSILICNMRCGPIEMNWCMDEKKYLLLQYILKLSICDRFVESLPSVDSVSSVGGSLA